MDSDESNFMSISSESLSEVDSSQDVCLQDSDMADFSDESSDSYLSLGPDPPILLKLPTDCARQLERRKSSPVWQPTRFDPSPLPELRRASDGDEESEEESCQKKKNRLARRIRLQQYLVNGPALANMPFDKGYHLRNKLSGQSETKENPRHRLLRIRNKSFKKKVASVDNVEDSSYFGNADLMLHHLVHIFLERIEKVVGENSNIFCNLMKTKNTDPRKLVMILNSGESGLTIDQILTEFFETVTEQDEGFVSLVASHLFNNDLFTQRQVLSNKKMCWMLSGSRYRRWIKSLFSSSSEE